MNPGDPTDHALAAIASIRDQPEAHPEPERAVVEEKPIVPELIEADGYHKVGPGPMTTIRIKWTARRENNGDYYVEETIGENSALIVSGPMGRDAAIRFVDEREIEARRQFEQLMSEMIGRSAAASMVRNERSEI